MKTFSSYISEAVTGFTPSEDSVKNAIFDALKEFKIVWMEKKVDALFEDITNKRSIINQYLTVDDTKASDRIYWAKCWNGGSHLNKYSPYNCADICSYNNNTPVKWFFVVRGKEVTVILYETRFYGMSDTKEVLNKFKIKRS
jgi:hypothetical protein